MEALFFLLQYKTLDDADFSCLRLEEGSWQGDVFPSYTNILSTCLKWAEEVI